LAFNVKINDFASKFLMEYKPGIYGVAPVLLNSERWATTRIGVSPGD
jgi:hypothetical protein